MTLCPRCQSSASIEVNTIDYVDEAVHEFECVECGCIYSDRVPVWDDEDEEEPEPPECPVCDDLGGNIYDDRATPCPLCGKI